MLSGYTESDGLMMGQSLMFRWSIGVIIGHDGQRGEDSWGVMSFHINPQGIDM